MSSNRELRRMLYVDDEPNALEAVERVLFEDFEVDTAAGGAAGLQRLRNDGPYAVLISDLRMPEMDGVEFLALARDTAPDTVRILLTAQADMRSAISAVNEGRIFHFLCKPCPTPTLKAALEAAIEQYDLIISEREVLENTLKGAVRALTEILGLAAPAAFRRCDKMRAYVAHMVEQQGIEDPWQYESAALLSQIGCVTLPPEVLDRVYARQPVSTVDQKMFDEHPRIGFTLLAHIPRLEKVAEMVQAQNDPESAPDPNVRLGAEMIRVALAVDQLVAEGTGFQKAVATLVTLRRHDKALLGALASYRISEKDDVIRSVQVRELRTFMVLDEDVCADNGNVVVSKGRELSGALVERLKNWHRGAGLVEPIRVRIPA